jgi:hypothetical protein
MREWAVRTADSDVCHNLTGSETILQGEKQIFLNHVERLIVEDTLCGIYNQPLPTVLLVGYCTLSV